MNHLKAVFNSNSAESVIFGNMKCCAILIVWNFYSQSITVGSLGIIYSPPTLNIYPIHQRYNIIIWPVYISSNDHKCFNKVQSPMKPSLDEKRDGWTKVLSWLMLPMLSSSTYSFHYFLSLCYCWLTNTDWLGLIWLAKCKRTCNAYVLDWERGCLEPYQIHFTADRVCSFTNFKTSKDNPSCVWKADSKIVVFYQY